MDKRKNKKILLIILILLLFAVITIAISYAWLQRSQLGEKNIIETGTLTISFSNDARISMLSATPLSDNEGYALTGAGNVSSYTLTNTGTIAIQYRIVLVPMTALELQSELNILEVPHVIDSQYLKYSVVNAGEIPTEGVKLLSLADNIFNESEDFVGYILDSGTLSASLETTISKDLRVWIDKNANVANSSFGFKLSVQALQQGQGVNWQEYIIG